MEIVKGFFDYCVSEDCIKASGYENTLKRLHKLGYRTIAINQVIQESNVEPTKKKKKKGESRDVSEVVPEPFKITPVAGFEDLKVLNRLTIVFSNQDSVNKILKSPNLKQYDILAVMPMTQAALQLVCSSIEADIFTYNSESKPVYKVNRKLYNQLVEKGYHFEITYSPTIQDTQHRRNMIAFAHTYHVVGKSRNVIISSGAISSIQLRSPYDVINLGLIFGLSEEQSKNSVLNYGRNVFIHSLGRRNGKALMFVKNIVEEDNCVSESSSEEEIVNELNSEDEEMETDQPAQKRCKL